MPPNASNRPDYGLEIQKLTASLQANTLAMVRVEQQLQSQLERIGDIYAILTNGDGRGSVMTRMASVELRVGSTETAIQMIETARGNELRARWPVWAALVTAAGSLVATLANHIASHP